MPNYSAQSRRPRVRRYILREVAARGRECSATRRQTSQPAIMVIDLIGKQYEEETHILARVRLNQLRVNRQQSGTAFHKRAGAASATNSVSLGCDCRAMELWRGPPENRRAHDW